MLRKSLILLALAAICSAQYAQTTCPNCDKYGYREAAMTDGRFHIGITASGIIGTGPFGTDIVGSVIEQGGLNTYDIQNFREEQGFLWGGEFGGFLRLPNGERIELLVTCAKTRAGLIASYTELQSSDSLFTYRNDSLNAEIIEITPKIRFSAAMPYGLEPYIGLGLAVDIMNFTEVYNVDGVFIDQRGGGFSTAFQKETNLYAYGLHLLLGTKVRITNNLAFHLGADGVFAPNKDLSLGELNNTVTPLDRYGVPRDPVDIALMPREHRLRLTHVTVRFGVEVSLDMANLR